MTTPASGSIGRTPKEIAMAEVGAIDELEVIEAIVDGLERRNAERGHREPGTIRSALLAEARHVFWQEYGRLLKGG